MSLCHSMYSYVTLPPGHGKTRLHARYSNVIEADTLVPCRENLVLDILRNDAKTTGVWTAYDEEWARLINDRLPLTPVIILVPSKSVGEAGGWRNLGGQRLQMKDWKQNMSNRPGGAEKHLEGYNQLAIDYPDREGDLTNAEMDQWFEYLYSAWEADTASLRAAAHFWWL